MKTEESPITNHGEFAFGEQMRATAVENRVKARKLPVNELDALWTEVMAMNRMAGAWGVDRPAISRYLVST